MMATTLTVQVVLPLALLLWLALMPAMNLLAHMQQGSLALQPGEAVEIGDYLGQVGNSGASTEPHLHIHAQRPAPERQPLISGEPLALRIEGRFLIRNDHLIVTE